MIDQPDTLALKNSRIVKPLNKKDMITISGVAPYMIANNLEPSTHSGEVLKDEIEYRGISQHKLAAEMGVPYTQLNEVLNAKRPLNTEPLRIYKSLIIRQLPPPPIQIYIF
jgi:hypothetical protein